MVSAESLKLCLSLWLLRRESGTTPRFLGALRKHLVDEPAEFAKLLIPAALYTLQNNLAYVYVRTSSRALLRGSTTPQTTTAHALPRSTPPPPSRFRYTPPPHAPP